MSGHQVRPGTQPRRTTRPAIWAIAAAATSLLAVAACSSTTTTTASPTTSAVAAAADGSGGHRPTLIGAGSTFDAPFFAVAFTGYQQQHPGVTISYAVVGSSAGIAAISAQQVDFGAADVPLNSELASAKGVPITQVPVDLGGEGMAYNLSLPKGARLHLTGPILAGIFLGQITRWNDPAITALNPGLLLPFAAIRNQAGNYVTPSAQTADMQRQHRHHLRVWRSCLIQDRLEGLGKQTLVRVAGRCPGS